MERAQSYAKKQKNTIYLKQSKKCLDPRVGKEYQANIPTLLSPFDPYGISWEGNVTPKSSSATWTCLEAISFLVALYIFGKDFFLVEKFLCGKDIGDIQSFYYGQFYNSRKYRKWTKFRKSARDQKPLNEIGTKRIFLRLRPRVQEEYKDAVQEAHRECKSTDSLMYYALLMKNTVGPKALYKGIKRELSYVDVEKGQPSRTAVAKKKSKHAKRGAGRAAGTVKWQKLTELESKPDVNVDKELKDESNDLVSDQSSNGRRCSRRSRVMSTKAVEAFETCSIRI